MAMINEDSEQYLVSNSPMEPTLDETPSSEESLQLEKIQIIENDGESINSNDRYGLRVLDDEFKIEFERKESGLSDVRESSNEANVDGQLSNNSSNKNDANEDFISKMSYDELIQFLTKLTSVKMPEIEFPMVFDFSDLGDPKLVSELTIGCKCLINKLKEIRLGYSGQSVYISYQIELRPLTENSSVCELFLRVDPSEWYELERHSDKNIKLTSMNYIERVRSKTIKYTYSFNELANRSTANSQRENLTCTKPSGCDNGNECGFYVCPAHSIYNVEGSWDAVARCSEYPIVTVNPKQHYSNEEWVQKPDAWKIILKVTNNFKNYLQPGKPPFQRIYINFGNWQSSNNGHAYVNIVLTAEAIKACQNVSGALGILQYSTKCPIDHRLDDSNELYKKINDENSLNDDVETDDELDKGLHSFDTYYSFVQPVESCSDRCLSVQLHGKLSILGNLLEQGCRKANKLYLDVCI